jgi:RNA polymerase subunit RPABC4/transcription elongation factor Spt4
MTVFLAGWPGGSLEATLKLGGLLLLAYALVLWLSAVVWVYRDVRNRTSDQASQLIAVLLVALFNLPGLAVYLVIRPQATMADAYERSLEAESILHELQLTANSCQTCQRPIDGDFNLCPHCRTILREACRSCGRPVRTSWYACPYCGADRAPARQQATPAPRPASQMEPPPRTTTPLTRPTAPGPRSSVSSD